MNFYAIVIFASMRLTWIQRLQYCQNFGPSANLVMLNNEQHFNVLRTAWNNGSRKIRHWAALGLRQDTNNATNRLWWSNGEIYRSLPYLIWTDHNNDSISRSPCRGNCECAYAYLNQTVMEPYLHELDCRRRVDAPVVCQATDYDTYRNMTTASMTFSCASKDSGDGNIEVVYPEHAVTTEEGASNTASNSTITFLPFENATNTHSNRSHDDQSNGIPTTAIIAGGTAAGAVGLTALAVCGYLNWYKSNQVRVSPATNPPPTAGQPPTPSSSTCAPMNGNVWCICTLGPFLIMRLIYCLLEKRILLYELDQIKTTNGEPLPLDTSKRPADGKLLATNNLIFVFRAKLIKTGVITTIQCSKESLKTWLKLDDHVTLDKCEEMAKAILPLRIRAVISAGNLKSAKRI